MPWRESLVGLCVGGWRVKIVCPCRPCDSNLTRQPPTGICPYDSRARWTFHDRVQLHLIYHRRRRRTGGDFATKFVLFLLFWRKLPARKFDAIERPKGFDFSAHVLRKQLFQFDIQHIGQHQKLQIRNAALSIFQSGNGALTGIPPHQLKFHGKLVLIPASLFTELTDLRPDDI